MHFNQYFFFKINKPWLLHNCARQTADLRKHLLHSVSVQKVNVTVVHRVASIILCNHNYRQDVCVGRVRPQDKRSLKSTEGVQVILNPSTAGRLLDHMHQTSTIAAWMETQSKNTRKGLFFQYVSRMNPTHGLQTVFKLIRVLMKHCVLSFIISGLKGYYNQNAHLKFN